MKIKILTLIMMAVLALICLTAACSPAAAKEIKIGALLPLSGDWATQGAALSTVLDIAAETINQDLAASGSRQKLVLIKEDTATDPETAQKKLKLLMDQDVNLVFGPATSAETVAIKDAAARNKIILVNTSSTAPSLALPDNVFRLVLNDNYQAKALTQLMIKDGIKVIIPLQRGDVWGDNLLAAVTAEFTAASGKVLSGARYPVPDDDYTDEIAGLKETLDQAIARYGASSTAIYLLSMDEASVILSQASADPLFSWVKWYGSDCTAKSAAIIKDAAAAEFAVKTGFISPIFDINYTTGKYPAIDARLQEKQEIGVNSYAMTAYDALYLMVKTQQTASADHSQALDQTFSTVSSAGYSGLSGVISLDENGDRKFGTFGFWVVKQTGGMLTWERALSYQFLQDQSGWQSE